MKTSILQIKVSLNVLTAHSASCWLMFSFSPTPVPSRIIACLGIRMSEGEVFHEKQRLELCAIHALNNVLQERVFTKETADDICKR